MCLCLNRPLKGRATASPRFPPPVSGRAAVVLARPPHHSNSAPTPLFRLQVYFHLSRHSYLWELDGFLEARESVRSCWVLSPRRRRAHIASCIRRESRFSFVV
ncbi:hypothetical protein L596_017473 [Steinernema carpocapsae]|uniref:Uncharacterized protein n=1 Tax=Steinernema carpocapsae TaxID=34508 RepID=A0A4U5N220_STECR|nr:hypothetical protein L596_017473 [Steinernema carpocapsae]